MLLLLVGLGSCVFMVYCFLVRRHCTCGRCCCSSSGIGIAFNVIVHIACMVTAYYAAASRACFFQFSAVYDVFGTQHLTALLRAWKQTTNATPSSSAWAYVLPPSTHCNVIGCIEQQLAIMSENSFTLQMTATSYLNAVLDHVFWCASSGVELRFVFKYLSWCAINATVCVAVVMGVAEQVLARRVCLWSVLTSDVMDGGCPVTSV
jgi:hypothetical protein